MDLDDIANLLEGIQESRERILTDSRRAISLCSRAIISVHRGRLQEASSALETVSPILEGLRAAALPETISYLVPAEQEYVEARALLSIAQNGSIPECDELEVMPQSYVLGLLDAVGELKRFVLDMMRSGDTASALRAFGIMEDLYLDLYRFSIYDKVLRESRRKLDVCRMVMEDTRLVITEEKSRRRLMDALDGAGDGI